MTKSLTREVQTLIGQWLVDLRPLPTSPLLVAVSGGPDSLALLHLLSQQFPPDCLLVAHLDHGLRPTAVAEAQFVAQTAQTWGIPCRIKQQNITQLAQEKHFSLEEAGRWARYQFFAELADQVGSRAVAVAHNADDQAETVLMHFLRGTGLAGLRGMQPIAPLPYAPHLTLLRPLLYTPRSDIEMYCRTHGLTPVEDASNADTTFFRNRLRHDLLPLLADYNPQIKTHLQKLASLVSADFQLLESVSASTWQRLLQAEGEGWLRLDRGEWVQLPVALQRATLRQAVLHLRPLQQDIAFAPIEQTRHLILQAGTGHHYTLPDGLRLTIEPEALLVVAPLTAVPMSAPQIPAITPLPVPGHIPLDNGWSLQTAWVRDPDWSAIQQNPDPWQAFFTLPAESPLFVRPRHSGERFQPLGLNGHSLKLKEVMINRHIPAALRPHWPLVATAVHPVWLVGHQLDERAKITAVTQPIIHAICRKN